MWKINKEQLIQLYYLAQISSTPESFINGVKKLFGWDV